MGLAETRITFPSEVRLPKFLAEVRKFSESLSVRTDPVPVVPGASARGDKCNAPTEPLFGNRFGSTHRTSAKFLAFGPLEQKLCHVKVDPFRSMRVSPLKGRAGQVTLDPFDNVCMLAWRATSSFGPLPQVMKSSAMQVVPFKTQPGRRQKIVYGNGRRFRWVGWVGPLATLLDMIDDPMFGGPAGPAGEPPGRNLRFKE